MKNETRRDASELLVVITATEAEAVRRLLTAYLHKPDTGREYVGMVSVKETGADLAASETGAAWLVLHSLAKRIEETKPIFMEAEFEPMPLVRGDFAGRTLSESDLDAIAVRVASVLGEREQVVSLNPVININVPKEVSA